LHISSAYPLRVLMQLFVVLNLAYLVLITGLWYFLILEFSLILLPNHLLRLYPQFAYAHALVANFLVVAFFKIGLCVCVRNFYSSGCNHLFKYTMP